MLVRVTTAGCLVLVMFASLSGCASGNSDVDGVARRPGAGTDECRAEIRGALVRSVHYQETAVVGTDYWSVSDAELSRTIPPRTGFAVRCGAAGTDELWFMFLTGTDSTYKQAPMTPKKYRIAPERSMLFVDPGEIGLTFKFRKEELTALAGGELEIKRFDRTRLQGSFRFSVSPSGSTPGQLFVEGSFDFACEGTKCD